MRNHESGSPSYCFDTSNPGRFTDVSVFFAYSLLLKIIANAIITAIAMIVIPISA